MMRLSKPDDTRKNALQGIKDSESELILVAHFIIQEIAKINFGHCLCCSIGDILHTATDPSLD